MTLYGLDFLVDNNNKIYFLELNGIMSGMHGFTQMYGDNRVEDKVHQMLQEKYGNITTDCGPLAAQRYRQTHPTQTALAHIIRKTPALCLFPFVFAKSIAFTCTGIATHDSSHTWMSDRPSKAIYHTPKYDEYNKDDSTIFNIINDQPDAKTINPYFHERITRNKLLAHAFFEQTQFSNYLIPSAFVGFGVPNYHLPNIIKLSETYISKPVLGSGGKGIRLVPKKTVEELTQTTLRDVFFPPKVQKLIRRWKHPYFQHGITMIQPFLDTKKKKKYRSIRSIVCNSTFIDAYQRQSNHFVANISQGACAIASKDKRIGPLSEAIISAFEQATFTQNREEELVKHIVETQLIPPASGFEFILPLLYNNTRF